MELYCTVGHKNHDPCFHKKYLEAGVMTFVAYCTCEPNVLEIYFNKYIS